MMNDRFGEKVFSKLVESINRHLPQKRQSLKALLEMEDPVIKARDGGEYFVERRELEFISENLDEDEWERFFIPIILEMTALGNEYVVYVRDMRHARFIERVFGFDRYVGNAMLLYTYEMEEIRKKLRTASQVMFRI